MKKSQYLNVVGLIVGFASLFFEILTPFWGIVFLYWVYHSVREQQIILFDTVTRQESAAIYWLIVTLWVLFSMYLLVYPFLI